MNKTVLIWMAIAALLAIRSFGRPSYAVGLYMMTFFAAPAFWWWGDIIEVYRWNFYAGLLLLLTLVFTHNREPLKGTSPLGTNAVPILGFMIANAVLVHVFLASNYGSSFDWLIARLKFILLFFLLQYSVRDERDYRIVVMAITLGMGYIGYEATINERGSFSGGRLEGVGAAGVQSSNQLASLLITGLPISVTLLFTRINNWLKGLVLVCCGLAYNVVLMCNSRGAFLGVIVGALAFLLMTTGPARKRSLRIAGVALLGAFMLTGDPEIVNRFMTTFTSGPERDNSAQSRIRFWTAASRMVADYPFGSGGNSFSEGRGWRYMGVGERDVRAVHNGFLTEMTDWGVQGFLLMIAFIGAIWRTLRRGRRLALEQHDPAAMMVYAGLAAGLTAWLVSCVFGDYLNDEWGFWTAAMAYSYLRVRQVAHAEQAVATEPPPQPEAVPVFQPVMPRSSAQ